MIISVNWLKQFTDINVPVDELVTLIGARLVEVEGVTDLSQKYKDVLVVKVVECTPIEGTDHLNLTKIDDGGVTTHIERDENGYIQVVCGAPNVAAGMLTAWLPVGSVVPETFSHKDPFVLSAKNLRGNVSNGMLASTRELDLWDSHDGIIEIGLQDAKPGDSFAKLYQLDDYLLDIENKSLTHRPDAFGIIGFAREVAAITGHAFQTPTWLGNLEPQLSPPEHSVDALKVSIDAPNISDRYQGIVLARDDSISGNQLSLMQTLLSRSGVRPIDPIVDVTNYVMLLTGQPLHAFDYDKLLAVAGDEPTIHVRLARPNETITLLDKRDIELSESDIVIAAGEKPVALAGAMGGADTQIDATTQRVFLESATFNLYNLRSTQMRHGVFSEALTRFTKGQPAGLTAPALAEAVRLLQATAGLKPLSDVTEAYPGSRDAEPVVVTLDTINNTLGTRLETDQIVQTLERIEFDIEKIDSDTLAITAPYWRADIHIPEDVIEEIGRIYGYDEITPTLPLRDFTAVAPSGFDQVRSRLRTLLARAGANEVLTYNFVHGDVLQKVGQHTEDSYKVVNSISPDLQYYRQSLSPSLLQLVHPNSKSGFETFALFEANKAHAKQNGTSDEGVPVETNALALVMSSVHDRGGAPYYQAKCILDFVAQAIGVQLVYDAIDQEMESPVAAPFEYKRSAIVRDSVSGERIGVIGEYKKAVTKSFKLPSYTAGFELDMDALVSIVSRVPDTYRPLSRYPSTERDICFQVDRNVSYSQIIDAVNASGVSDELETVVSPVDIYQPDQGDTKNITVRVKLTSFERTLTNQDISQAITTITESVQTATHAQVI